MAESKTYGKVWLDGEMWSIAAEPHIILRIKRVFQKIAKGQHGTVTLTSSPENSRDLDWFMDRYPMRISRGDRMTLTRRAGAHEEHVLRLEQILGADYQPRQFDLQLPPRDYQARATELLLAQGFLLCGDDLGLGKTVVAIAAMADQRALPAVVVCYPHLQRQWEEEIRKFAPALAAHVIAKGTPYELPKFMGRGPDVLIITYSKLSRWAETLAEYASLVVFDEAQELRRSQSEKYQAAAHVASACEFRLGLTATPIYNYGGEVFNILDCLQSGVLGNRDEFVREWCSTTDSRGNAILKDPKAFGSYLREQGYLLRRTREEVGRELPPVTKILHTVDSDRGAIEKVQDAAGELARIILSKTESFKGERMNAADQFSTIMRQATGLAKAPHVADFVNMLLESEPKVLLAGWHRAVYEVWQSRLERAGRKVVYYTGTEGPAAKVASAEEFIKGDAEVMIISLRSGAGLNGLQEACRALAVGELDWAPAVVDQLIGRLNRDGALPGGVTAYFLVSDEGADPVMTEVLGLKREQAEGVRNPSDGQLIERLETGGGHIKRLAEQFLKKQPVASQAA